MSAYRNLSRPQRDLLHACWHRHPTPAVSPATALACTPAPQLVAMLQSRDLIDFASWQHGTRAGMAWLTPAGVRLMARVRSRPAARKTRADAPSAPARIESACVCGRTPIDCRDAKT